MAGGGAVTGCCCRGPRSRFLFVSAPAPVSTLACGVYPVYKPLFCGPVGKGLCGLWTCRGRRQLFVVPVGVLLCAVVLLPSFPYKKQKKLSTVYMYPKTPSLRALVRRQPQVYGRQSRCLCAYTESWSVWSIRAMSKAQNFSTRPWALTLCRSEMKAG